MTLRPPDREIKLMTLRPPDREIRYNDTETCVPGSGHRISRADVARYMLDVIEDKTSYQKIRAIAVDNEERFLMLVKEQMNDFLRTGR